MKQTNRTILIKEINPDVGSILSYVHEIENKKSLSDADIQKIHEKLEISSFEEFMRKFEPSIYMMLDTNELSVCFSERHLGAGEEVIRLDHPDSIFSMLTQMIDAKQQKKYILAGFSDMLKNLIPKEHVEEIVSERNRLIHHLMEKNFVVKRKLTKELRTFFAKYDDGLLLLMGFIMDMEWNTLHTGLKTKKDRSITTDDDALQVSVLKVGEEDKKMPYFTKEQAELYEACVVKAYEDYYTGNPTKNTRLMQEFMLIPTRAQNKDIAYLKTRYELYSNFYIKLIKQFWIVSKPLMETMIGVKEFYKQYQDVEGMRPKMVIANFQATELLQGNLRDEFDLYLETVNDKNYQDNTIWYAILPNLAADRVKKEQIRERFVSNREPYIYPSRYEEPETAIAIELLARHRILTFMSYEVTEENTFSGFAKFGIDWLNNQLAPFDRMEEKEYVIPCFPNFIVVSKEEAAMNIGVELTIDEELGELYISSDKNVWFDEVGIEASYIGAGLVAACQCPEFLKKHFASGVIEDMPGVAYRFTEDGHNMETISNMLSDSVEFTPERVAEISSRSKGLFFGQLEGKMTILTERTMGYSYGNQMLISMIQTSIYIERMIQYETQDFKKNLIRDFFLKKPDSLIVRWKPRGSGWVNQILKDDEELSYDLDEKSGSCTFSLQFKNHGYVKNHRVEIFKE